MGMYTEILIRVNLDKRLLTEDVNPVIDYLFGEGLEPEQLPDHDFFKCRRWRHLAGGVVWDAVGKLISIREFKNYNGEAKKFFNWIGPYLDNYKGECIGYTWFELDAQPNLYYQVHGDL